MKRKRFAEEPMIGVLKEAEARRAIESWRVHCNAARPRRPLGFLAPEEFRAAGETGCGKNRPPASTAGIVHQSPQSVAGPETGGSARLLNLEAGFAGW